MFHYLNTKIIDAIEKCYEMGYALTFGKGWCLDNDKCCCIMGAILIANGYKDFVSDKYTDWDRVFIAAQILGIEKEQVVSIINGFEELNRDFDANKNYYDIGLRIKKDFFLEKKDGN